MITSDPLTIIYAFVDDQSMIKGFIWTSINPLTQELRLSVLSVDKEYYGSDVLPNIKELIIEMLKAIGIKKCVWSTTRPEAFEKVGFVKSDLITMEFMEV